jgi:S-adenosyl-L-methionine hydrolase (adenosine-forming)
MSIITLTSDWGLQDHYLGAVKGKILCLEPKLNIIDLNHNIQAFNLAQAAFVIRNSFHNFPEGTVHMICVGSEGRIEQRYLAARSEDQYFITSDNGILGLLFNEDPLDVISINKPKKADLAFPERDVFAPAACHLAMNKPLEELGAAVKDCFRQRPLMPTIDESVITGSVIYIDSYQNAITNITRELFDRIAKGRKFDIFVKSNHYRIDKLNKGYQETSVGEILALFNSSGLLEIAINNGNAASLLNLDNGSAIRVKFKE